MRFKPRDNPGGLAAAGLAQDAGDAVLGDVAVDRPLYRRRQHVHEDGLRIECPGGHGVALLVPRFVGELRCGGLRAALEVFNTLAFTYARRYLALRAQVTEAIAALA